MGKNSLAHEVAAVTKFLRECHSVSPKKRTKKKKKREGKVTPSK
jgi:hypothetical protein